MLLPAGPASSYTWQTLGVIDAGSGAGLTKQALPEGKVNRGLANALDGDGAIEAVVMGGVDHAHPALTQLAGDAIAADGRRFRSRLHGLPSPAEHAFGSYQLSAIRSAQ